MIFTTEDFNFTGIEGVWHKGIFILFDYSRGCHDIEVSATIEDVILEEGETSPFIADGQHYHQRYLDYAEDFIDEDGELLRDDFEEMIKEMFEQYIIEQQKKLVWTPQTGWLD